MVIDVSLKARKVVEEMKDTAWVRLPMKALRDENLTPLMVCVLAVIIDRTDGKAVEISSAAIAEEVCCSIRTVKTAIKKLSEANYIKVQHTQGGASVYSSTILDPKRRKPSKSSKEQAEPDVSSVEKYKEFINKF